MFLKMDTVPLKSKDNFQKVTSLRVKLFVHFEKYPHCSKEFIESKSRENFFAIVESNQITVTAAAEIRICFGFT